MAGVKYLLCNGTKQVNRMKKNTLTTQKWREKLTPEQFNICRMKGTERAFSGKYTGTKKKGVYHCVCCSNRLFSSEVKFDSGSGWPSFWDVIDKQNISENSDVSHGMRRVEVTCQACDAHLGHVFEDGPKPTGLRYCINSTSLKLVEET